MPSIKNFSFFLLISVLLLHCTHTNVTKQEKNKTVSTLNEYTVKPIKLHGEINNRKAELSGLSWYKNNLILLPQFPDRFSETKTGKIYFIKKEQITNFISGKDTSAIQPDYYSINTNEFENLFVKGSGFESVTFHNNIAYFTIESVNLGKTVSYLITGTIDTTAKTITLQKASLTLIPNNVNIHNMGDESILYFNNEIIPIYEANGKNVNPHPLVTAFNIKTWQQKKLEFPNIEYRITDVTNVDSNNTFWAINYFYPGEEKKLKPATDILTKKYGIGKTHISSEYVERLVRFKIDNKKIELTNTIPIYLKLPENRGRNWEGIVRLDNKGFLLATDMYPETILGYVSK